MALSMNLSHSETDQAPQTAAMTRIPPMDGTVDKNRRTCTALARLLVCCADP